MGGSSGRSSVRLAELVAALSLGIDLGFGQPMEHVLRQCLIATRLAQRVGLDEQDRAGVYYTALLINVGCHTDAHEQAKWFGDDIDMKSTKYDYEHKSFRGAVSMLRQFGAGNPPLQRVRRGVEFALHGRHDVAGMIARHAQLAQMLAVELGLGDVAANALGAGYEQWDGKGWPGELSGEEVPIAARIAVMAEYLEVANRVHGVDAARSLAARRAGNQFDPNLVECLDADADFVFAGLDVAETWAAVIDAEPSLTVVLSDDQFDVGVVGDRQLRRSQVALHAWPLQGGRRPRRGRWRASRLRWRRDPNPAARRAGPRLRPARGLQRHLGQGGAAGRR